MHNVMEKTFEIKFYKGIIGQVDNHEPNLALHKSLSTSNKNQKINSKWCFKKMVMQSLWKTLMKSIYVLLFANYSKKGMHTTSIKGKISLTNLKWVWKDCESKMFIPIISIKNGRESNKNLVVMIRSTRAQLPR